MQQSLYLVRHAHASNANSDDIRPLSDKGHRQLDRLCTGLKGKDLVTPGLIWHSGLHRAEETARRLKEGLELEASLETVSGLTPFDIPRTVVSEIESHSESILIAGHEPNLSVLSSILLAGDLSFERFVFAKASVLCLSRLAIGNQSTSWQIEWHLNHRHFKS